MAGKKEVYKRSIIESDQLYGKGKKLQDRIYRGTWMRYNQVKVKGFGD
jgi:hypothetical protein